MRRSKLWGLIVTGYLATGCELVATFDLSKVETGTESSGGECTQDSDCAAPGNECLLPACVDGQCVPEPVAANTPVADQTDGDCQVLVCDGAGSVTGAAADADLPVDGKECTDDVCTAGVASNPPVTEGTACGDGGALFCDAVGECVGCQTNEDCGAPTECATPTCTDGACQDVFTAPGTPVMTQVDGDCKQVQCDGIGGTKSEDDDADVADDGNECTDDVCLDGTLTHPNMASGSTCNDGGIKCNGAGACVECNTAAECDPAACNGAMYMAAESCDGSGACVAGAVTDCAATSQVCNVALGCVECNTAAECAPASCNGAIYTSAETCNGSNACVAGAVTDCAATSQVCNAAMGCVQCNSDVDCTAPTTCVNNLCTSP